MSEPFLAEIRIVGFNFAPRGWAFCDGQLLPINQNQSLFSLLGTTYGGDGRTSFALPDLRGRTAIHAGNSNSGTSYRLGQRSGEETHTLTVSEMPTHDHLLMAASEPGNQLSPGGNFFAKTSDDTYSDASNLISLDARTVSNAGGSQPHENRQPYIGLNFCIALQGLFPSRN